MALAEALARDLSKSGGPVVNGTIHLTDPNLPFGGVGAGGVERSQGEHGFRTFSHERAVLHEGRGSGVRFLYPPYGRPLPRFMAWAMRKLEG